MYHLGLQRMFRFSAADNAAAAAHFETAVKLEPGFARAYAGLSFTRFQNAYLGFDPDRGRNAAEAKALAEAAVGYDSLDPFAAFTLGRAHWLEGDVEGSLGWLERSCTLSPSYAQGVYARAWAETMLGRSSSGRTGVDSAIELSPLDPFLFAMRGTRALSYIVEGRTAEAVFWIDEAARTPGANAIVNLVAAVAHAMNGDVGAASEWVKRARARNPDVSTARFFNAIPFADTQLRSRVAAALSASGLV
jgi:tetratricopeptide (TPR) repeat protein